MAAALLIYDFLFLFLWNMLMFSPIFNLGKLSYFFFMQNLMLVPALMNNPTVKKRKQAHKYNGDGYSPK